MLRLYKENNDSKSLAKVAQVLQSGGIIVMPTDSSYKLACAALNAQAVERVYRLKEEDVHRSRLSIICYSISAISEYAKIATWVFKLLKQNLPGPFTFILPGLKCLPKVFRVKNKCEVGVRMPNNEIVKEISNYFGAPILVASIPLRGEDEEMRLYPEWIEEVWGKDVDLVIDGGRGQEGYSTIVDCTGDEEVVVREGTL